MRICMLAYSYYEGDNRIIRYSNTLVKEGNEVDVISIRKEGEAKFKKINGVNVYQTQKRMWNEKTQLTYLFRMTRFLITSSLQLSWLYLKYKYEVIHVHSIPDFLVFAAWLPKLLGAKIILDMHDLVPEYYKSKFNLKKDSFDFKSLLIIEKMSIAFSNHVIISNHVWKEKLISRSLKRKKCTAILNYPDTDIFSATKKRKRNNGKTVLLYPGSLNWHQGLDIAIQAFSMLSQKNSDIEFHIYGSGSETERLISLISRLKLESKVIVHDPVDHEKIADLIADADLGIVPKRNDTFGNEAFSTKIFEFMCYGIPVIVSDTKVDRYYFNDHVVKFFKAGDIEDLANSIVTLIENKALYKRLSENSLNFVKKFHWKDNKDQYLKLLESLVSGNREKIKLKKYVWLYYLIRPLIPNYLRVTIRRCFVRSMRKKYTHVWPILKNVTIPKKWIGWPEKKQFCLVLTHDVESIRGLSKCQALMNLEKRWNFRSSFNFVTMKYSVSKNFRESLVDQGFEIGIHGYLHDGKLFKNKKVFTKRAIILNKFIDEWGSVGFRSPSMICNLEYLHDLRIEYDSSTFDIDPFEPQSGDVHSIFPLLITSKDRNNNGYIELPYTLPQDYTLFILMKEKNINIWTRKIDWIADKGGMVLIDTHPDYMNLGKEKCRYYEYPGRFYIELLDYIASKYRDKYWHVLPKEIARFWRNQMKL